MFYVVLISSPVSEFEAEAFKSGRSQTLVYIAGLHSGSVKSAVLYTTLRQIPTSYRTVKCCPPDTFPFMELLKICWS